MATAFTSIWNKKDNMNKKQCIHLIIECSTVHHR